MFHPTNVATVGMKRKSEPCLMTFMKMVMNHIASNLL